ncbi:hypothetical protein HPB50_002265 [Hyalomma asiaticum]|uniref:Uncharacterized protein n=1 Tax=Hyalomma asiaticum TaxID=266040 RepID=A0ACB7TB77_HYAAI|nr:hypothetical protein HPB50_002265 [Hyalomma asiaticum]
MAIAVALRSCTGASVIYSDSRIATHTFSAALVSSKAAVVVNKLFCQERGEENFPSSHIAWFPAHMGNISGPPNCNPNERAHQLARELAFRVCGSPPHFNTAWRNRNNKDPLVSYHELASGRRSIIMAKKMTENGREDESVSMLLNANAQCTVSDEEVLNKLELLHVSLIKENYDSAVLDLLTNVCELLKLKGESIDSSFTDQMDCYFDTLRNAARDDNLDVIGRVRLLEVIELRASGWKFTDECIAYYKYKYAALQEETARARALALLKRIEDDPHLACFVDAARCEQSSNFSTVIVDHSGQIVNAASLKCSTPSRAEQVAVPIALLDNSRTQIFTDSRLAVRDFASGSIAGDAHKILKDKTISLHTITWFSVNLDSHLDSLPMLNDIAQPKPAH